MVLKPLFSELLNEANFFDALNFPHQTLLSPNFCLETLSHNCYPAKQEKLGKVLMLNLV